MLRIAVIAGRLVFFHTAQVLIVSYLHAIAIALFFKVPRKETYWRLLVANTIVIVVYLAVYLPVFYLNKGYFNENPWPYALQRVAFAALSLVLSVVAYIYALRPFFRETDAPRRRLAIATSLGVLCGIVFRVAYIILLNLFLLWMAYVN